MNQYITTLITGHSLTREYLCRRKVILSDLCPEYLIPETYTHVAIQCPRFQQQYEFFGTAAYIINIDKMITSLLDKNVFSDFCLQLFLLLRSFN